MSTLPQIGEYQSRVSAEANVPVPQMRPSNAGEGLVAIGESLQRVQDADAATKAAAGLANLRVAATRALLGPQLNGGSAAPTGDKSAPAIDALGAFDKSVTAEVNNLPATGGWFGSNVMARKRIQAGALELRADLQQKALEQEANANIDSRILSFQNSGAKAATAVEIDPNSWTQAGAEQLGAIHAAGLPPAMALRLSNQIDTQISEAAGRGYAKQDPRGTLARLQDPKDALFAGMSPASREQMFAYAQGQLVQQTTGRILSVYQSAGTDAGTRALADLSKQNLPPEIATEVRSKVNDGVGQLRTQRREEHVQEITGVQRALATDTAGNGTRAQVQSLYAVGALTPAEEASYQGAIDASILQQHHSQAGAVEIAQLLRAGIPLDPKDEVQRKALSQAFAIETTGTPMGSPNWQASAISYADRARMLPDQAYAWTRQAMRSPDPALAANAAQFFGAVSVASPDAVGQFDDTTKAFATTVNGMIEAGTPPAKAVETARETVFDTKPEIIERRKTEYAVQVKTSDQALGKYIDRDLGAGWFHSDPTATAGLSADFSSQASRYYAKVGDITLARDLAWADLRRVYGVSQVNGTGQVMAFPPERFGVKPEEVRTDLSNFLKGNPQSDGSGSADIFLVPDALTLRAAADALNGQPVRPSYKLVTKTGDLVLDRNGIPKRYTVPGGEEITKRIQAAQAAAVAEAQRQIAQAKVDRAARQQRELMQSWGK